MPFALIVCLAGSFTGAAHAQAEKPALKWGTDSTGGAPYIFDNKTKGFEVELAAHLAKELGRAAESEDADWDKLPLLLEKEDVDIVLNGYEYSKRFREQASIPYYIYRLTLTVHTDNEMIQTWADLHKGKKKVGVLEGSAAERYMSATYGESIDLRIYRDVISTFQLVANGEIDATVQDNPASNYHVPRDPKLKQLEETKEQGAYVILTRIGDAELRKNIDNALRKAIEDGTLQKIYEKYDLWNDDQERLLYWKNKSWGERKLTPIQQKLNAPEIVWPIALRELMLAGAMTVFLAIASMPLATLVGMFVAILRLYGPRVLKPILAAYVEILRGTPLILQLFVLYYVLPTAFPPISALSKSLFGNYAPIAYGILGLALNYSASQAEHFRGAFLNLPRGQYEAALSLGMTRWTAIRHIIAPQAFRAAVPSVTNDFVALFKDTAVCSLIAVMELTKQYNTLYNGYPQHILGLAAITACMYLMMSYPLAMAARRLEHKAEWR